ncbi:MAG: MoaD/ThiS family protein [Acidobacteria bacterium]|nr:MoaD/ThiS family protein [Acidobacteriota bacterium]MCA1639141.1 MoaD/ThiS family protein [Acidobacteriota bacterium]
MKVRVLFFGATAEAVGKREIEFSLAENTNASEARTEILEAFPNLKKYFGKSLLFAINQEYASGDEIINNGDELAIFTAVSGG